VALQTSQPFRRQQQGLRNWFIFQKETKKNIQDKEERHDVPVIKMYRHVLCTNVFCPLNIDDLTTSKRFNIDDLTTLVD
jgi:hypothetical protein